MGRIFPPSAHLISAPNSLAVGSFDVWAQRVGRMTQCTSRASSKNPSRQRPLPRAWGTAVEAPPITHRTPLAH
jgi:hypothetical protein